MKVAVFFNIFSVIPIHVFDSKSTFFALKEQLFEVLCIAEEKWFIQIYFFDLKYIGLNER